MRHVPDTAPDSDSVGDWLALLDAAYPRSEAADWDRPGLQVGDVSAAVARVLVSLDVTSDVVAEAAQVSRTLVIAHHPLLMRPLVSLTPSTASGRIALAAAAGGVAVAAAHTNLDVARDGAGTSDPVASLLGLRGITTLTSEPRTGERLLLVTFVPEQHVEHVVDALHAAGAGRVGDYERCAFRTPGTGTFRPLPGSTPYSGSVGRDATEPEIRVDMELPASRAATVVRALVAVHPYDEVAYHLLPRIDGTEVGFGLVGDVASPRRLADVAETIRTALPSPHLRFAGDPDRLVSRVATVGGAGDGLIAAALSAGADVYVTGDLRHHVTLDALEQGLALVDAGHHATEHAAMDPFTARLAGLARAWGLTAPVVASRTPTDPWRWHGR